MTRLPAGLVALARCGWAAACLAAPGAVGRAAGVDPADRRAVAVVRLLGVREAVQAALVGASRSAEVSAVGVWVDAAHALSMAGLAAGSARYRRPALVSAATAAGWAVLGSREAGTAGSGRPARAAAQLLPWLPGAADPGRRR